MICLLFLKVLKFEGISLGGQMTDSLVKNTVNLLCMAVRRAHFFVRMCDHVCVALLPLPLSSYILIRAALSQ